MADKRTRKDEKRTRPNHLKREAYAHYSKP